MDGCAVSQWNVVGTFRKRPVLQGPIVDFTSDLSHRNYLDNADAPVLLYEAKTDEGHQQARVPRYMARKISIPPPSLRKMKVVSLAPPFPTEVGGRSDGFLFVDCPEPPDSPSHNRDGVRRHKALIVGTILPTPLQWAILLPFVVFLADILWLVLSLTTYKLEKRLTAACCVLVLVPDAGAFFLLLKRGIYSVTIAVHLLLWPNIVLFYLQPFISQFYMIHFLSTTLMVLYCLRVRASTYMTFCTLR